MKKEVEEVQEQEKSYFWQMIHLLKDNYKKLFIICIIELVIIFLLGGFIFYIFSNIEKVEDTYTQQIENIDTIDNSSISNGGN